MHAASLSTESDGALANLQSGEGSSAPAFRGGRNNVQPPPVSVPSGFASGTELIEPLEVHVRWRSHRVHLKRYECAQREYLGKVACRKAIWSARMRRLLRMKPSFRHTA
jgi:hypothetical protein